jgi:hypothetical protein
MAEHEVADEVVYVERRRVRFRRVGPARPRYREGVGFGGRLLLIFDDADAACAVQVLRQSR